MSMGVENKPGNTCSSNHCSIFRHEKYSSSPKLEILAFETAKTMSRLVALYRSLSDDEFSKLRQGPMKSPGVAFLNSTDERYLLGLACKEKLEDLDQAATLVTRLSKKCVDEELNWFDITYHDMKQGISDVRDLVFGSRKVGKAIEKMKKYANATSSLHASLVALNELEVSERKMEKWKRNDSPKRSSEKTNIDYFDEKISFQKKQVRYFKQVSLWSQTFDKSVGLMARIVCVVYARICAIFGPFVTSLPCTTSHRRIYISNPKTLQMNVYPEANYCLYMKEAFSSGLIMKASMTKPDKGIGFRISAVTITDKVTTKTNNIETNTRKTQRRLIQSAPANTAGAAGLAIRYANIIIMAESYFYSTTIISDEAREYMYDMLPISLKQTLRRKLRSHWGKGVDEEVDIGQQGLAQGWREALEEILGWLAPVAHDTLIWQQERNLEQQKLDAKPTVSLLQTLHYSDLEKTEAAIVEVLVGLSCICRYENRRERRGVGYNKPIWVDEVDYELTLE
ncbi:hypothetical protein PTKIN_Ptkin13bG0285000 [Pterospermum kingtungense]